MLQSELNAEEWLNQANVEDIKKESEFPFERARRVTPEENHKFRAAISEQSGMELRKRGGYY
ncbi:MAG: hypothetical protein F6K21_17090 [Symploca sp. SIO2D2]|nr:hypothetical protein [Symploca sp. SIO2D2]NER24715.1 hypothetical protein [Symploca sp. SIO1C2]